MRCPLCNINWPHNVKYQPCPFCRETTKSIRVDEDDVVLTEAQACELLRERAPATAPRSKLLAAFSLQRERETLQADLERWAKEVPPWMR